MQKLTIGKMASAAEVGIDTVRFYERGGLLKRPQRTPAGYRLYDKTDLARLRFIRRAKALGFSLEEIAELLRLNDGGGRRSAVRALAEQRLREIEQKVSELGRMRDTLRHLVQKCHGDGSIAGCPIIEAVLPERKNAELGRRIRRSA
ncbi:MAG: MerR family DNA-binding protein [Gammaproteobacteria bacterium]|nr:MerR family DNA-binding protein [Gammaproteobacteria bacterium]